MPIILLLLYTHTGTDEHLIKNLSSAANRMAETALLLTDRCGL